MNGTDQKISSRATAGRGKHAPRKVPNGKRAPYGTRSTYSAKESTDEKRATNKTCKGKKWQATQCEVMSKAKLSKPLYRCIIQLVNM